MTAILVLVILMMYRNLAGLNFTEQHGLLSDAMYRNLMVTRMDKIVREQIFLKFTALKYLKANITLSQINKIPTMGYYYGSTYGNVSLLFIFYFTELGAYFCYIYKEKFIKTKHYKISEGYQIPYSYV